MTSMRKLWMSAIFALTLALSVLPVLAQDQPDQNEGPDPPGRVARLNYSNGSVSFQPGGEGDWVTAVPNRPLTTGDNLWADQNSRAELHIGSTAIRMDSETSMTFLNLDDHNTQLKLSAGSLIVRLRHLDDGDNFEIDTPNLAFELLRTGEYRIDVNPDGNETIATVLSGRGEATGGGDSYTVIGGQQAHFTGTDNLDHEISQIPAPDDFVRWVRERDQKEDDAESANYVSPEMTGYEDLDDYGQWHYVADYGTVWTPRGLAGDWAPYRYGHWVWVSPWGWTWVEDEPWGFAPFHYGRWAFVESSWCWVPGPVVVRPVYAPALVAFVGGGGFSISVGVGPGVAWFPLAPREVYVPWYRTSRVYVNNVNISNTRVNVTQVTNVYNIYNTRNTNVTRVTYVNQTRAVTVVSHDTFVNARPVYRNLAHVDQRQFEHATVVRDVPAQPSRESVIGAGRPVSVRPPVRIVDRQVVGVHTPPPVRNPFEQRPAPVNVRTETPHEPQPAAQGQAPRTGQPPRPETGIRRNDNPEQRPTNQGDMSRNVPRPPNVERPQPNNPQSGREAQPNPPDRNAGRPQQGNNGRGWVRPAPPVQDRPQQQQNEERKFRDWQQQRQQSRPPEQHAQPPRPQPQAQPQREAPRPQEHAPQRPDPRSDKQHFR